MKKRNIRKTAAQSWESLLTRVGVSDMPENVLIGALLDVYSQYNRTSQQAAKWAVVGDNFLKGVRGSFSRLS
jgi:hypothetical protein